MKNISYNDVTWILTYGSKLTVDSINKQSSRIMSCLMYSTNNANAVDAYQIIRETVTACYIQRNLPKCALLWLSKNRGEGMPIKQCHRDSALFDYCKEKGYISVIHGTHYHVTAIGYAHI